MPIRKRGEREAGLNDRLRRALLGLDPSRIENSVSEGTPDITYARGWIESKRLVSWPKKANTPVRVPHYVPEQRAWHVRHRAAGGVVYVVIEVEGVTFAFDGTVAAQFLGFMTRGQMYAKARFNCYPWDGKAFRKFIDTDKLPGVA